ncbi:SUMF1/EgtB/PvdO family nonheme iron enzyme [Haliscomenobacter hydrossis]|uniref:Sulphatase-modifying factor protein n=1 Tax=Haliscomenobacter hydrossis (strain ATCC 27775 / DSM 1100 / LMG 10767 / O) TaxID=760192 RepID=F4L7D7_HALH1|nr:SUMF1/EgtB/PvdO family nonheme iron enzyme [Haliscomenobacter hydrossis]AEE53164.1 Sulphatase-modifying factor protein [Haliscomenobacter hydrossis DSM 1100]
MANRDTLSVDQKDGEKASRPNGKNYLLAIAIDAYKNCSQLNNAVNDAAAFIDLMTSRYNVETAHVTFIKDEQATKRSIDLAFLRLIKLITPQDNLIVYFSGHGRYDEHYGGNWVPVEAGIRDDDWPDYLSNDQVKSYLSRIKSFHTFLIADSCFSGSLFIDKSKEKFSGDRRDTEPSRWGLTSGKKEIVSDGQPGQHSPFAAALLDVLRKADQPPGVMRICDLVLEKVAANAQQMPMGSPLQVVGHQGGQLVFYFREDEEQAWALAQGADTIRAYTDFYDKYPYGNYTEQALDKLEELEEKSAWDKVPKNRQALLLRYLRENPRSPYVKEAQRLLDALRGAEATTPIEEKGEIQPVFQAQAPPAIVVPKLIVPEHMILVKGGSFDMGDVMSDKEFYEERVHTVTLSDFMIAKFQLTFAEYDTFCEATGRELPDDAGWGRGEKPVINVSWFDAIDYCNWCSEQEGLQQVYQIVNQNVSPNWNTNGYRLPTTAEWEYAARSRGEKVRFGNGKNVANPKEINFKGLESNQSQYSMVGEYREKTVPVGSLNSPNALGLYDMSGNVWEWCWDWYEKGYFSNTPVTNPHGSNNGSERVLRGGSWGTVPSFCRVSSRSKFNPVERNEYIGFRVARRSAP